MSFWYGGALPPQGGDFKERFKVRDVTFGKCQLATNREKSPKICISEAIALQELCYSGIFFSFSPIGKATLCLYYWFVFLPFVWCLSEINFLHGKTSVLCGGWRALGKALVFICSETLRYLPYRDRLRMRGLFSLEKRRFCGNLRAAFHVWRGYREAERNS